MRSGELGRAILARLTRFGIVAGMALLSLMASLVVMQVVARNFFDMGLPWADEMARFCGIGLVFLGIPFLAGGQLLVAVTVLPDALTPPSRRLFVLAADLATLAFAGLMLWSFAEFLPRAGKFLTPAMQVTNNAYYSLALLGSVALAGVALHRILATLRRRDPSDAFLDPPADPDLPS